ncbi:jg19635 [Pararge aegeria aegeria]|uniref:Jg19635 protein n=1 Tax=Pararge aegeria aegeria TaxID=348720 RepID=A0A8S4S777_9NEOP|nr:jg19635 [Pararge aegeria aegeria]
MVKRYFLTEHVFVRDRHMDLKNDRAIDEYILGLLKQGNSLFAKLEDGTIAGLCVNFAASPVDPQNLRNYAFYRQDPNTKDFLYYTAKLQETPNLWSIFEEDKVFEIKMLAVLPEYRRQGTATMLAQKSKTLAQDLGYRVVRMDCINPYDYKIAERCMLSCLVKFPLHKLRGPNAPFIKKTSENNTCVRVFVETPVKQDSPKLTDLESMFE